MNIVHHVLQNITQKSGIRCDIQGFIIAWAHLSHILAGDRRPNAGDALYRVCIHYTQDIQGGNHAAGAKRKNHEIDIFGRRR